MAYNYNTDVSLWSGYPSGTLIMIVDGHAYQTGHGYTARFDSDEHAKRVLTEAGFNFKHASGGREVWEKQ